MSLPCTAALCVVSVCALTAPSVGAPPVAEAAPGVVVAGGLSGEARGPCNLADLAEPFGNLSGQDICAFIDLFLSHDAAVDFNADGAWDLGDIQMFVQAFVAGCP